MDKIIIHTNESCPYCKQIKDELTNNNIEFENRFNSEFKDDWEKISIKFGVTALIVPKDWKITLKPKFKGNDYIYYSIVN